MIKKIFFVFSGLLLIYMIWPGPGKISDFSPLPSSDKSDFPGDTYQISNVAGYFSDNYRVLVNSFYKTDYRQKTHLPFPPIELVHPPEYSWQTIKKHTDSTYLIELVYPLRDSLYINGFEPFYSDGNPKFWGSTKLEIFGHSWYTKTTLRFYPSNFFIRIIVWLGVVISIFWLYKLGRRIIFNL